MRVVAGRLGGHPLLAPRGNKTRPTADRVREALFSALFSVEGARVLDLFAGTGAVGIEALSRGAAFAVFVERARPAQAALQKNIKQLQLKAESRLLSCSVAAALPLLEGERFELIFADPPYADAKAALPKVLSAAVELLTEDGRLVLELAGRDESPKAPPGLQLTRRRDYGEAALLFYERAEG